MHPSSTAPSARSCRRNRAMTTNPGLTPRPLRHKLLPPMSFAAPPSLDEGERLTCKVSFEQRNGVPSRAVLVPVVLEKDQWKVVQDGRLVDLPDIRRIDDAEVLVFVSPDGKTVT